MSTSAIPTPCPVCGAYSLTREHQTSALLAVCDVLCVKAPETIGKRLVRVERSRHKVLGNRPWHEAHSIWRVDDREVSKALKGAWDVVPAMLDTHGYQLTTADQVTRMLDGYVHDLVITGTLHRIEELAYRFTDRLDLPVHLETAS